MGANIRRLQRITFLVFPMGDDGCWFGVFSDWDLGGRLFLDRLMEFCGAHLLLTWMACELFALNNAT